MDFVGRIAYSSDGNFHDLDDIAATPLALALLSKAGLAEKLVHFHHSNHFWQTDADMEARMVVSSIDTIQDFWSGFNPSVFFNDRANHAATVAHLTSVINASTAADPLWLIGAGPMETIGQAVAASYPSARQHVYLISHNVGFNDTTRRTW